MNLQGREIVLFTGNANRKLAGDISGFLGIPLADAEVGKFSDGETSVSVYQCVRGCDCFIIQPTSDPTNDNLMELLILIDALKRASAGRINAVMPYFGYARQDRKAKGRDPISAKLVANLIQAAGADTILTMDLHASQIQGFFDIPVNHLEGAPVLTPYIEEKFHHDYSNMMIMSPDVGSIKRARNFAKAFDVPIAICDKRRQKANVSEVMNIIGDVRDRDIVIFDDMVDTAGTLVHAAEAIKKAGARSITACASHGVLSGNAVENVRNSEIDELVLLDTIDIPEEKRIDKITVLSSGKVFAECISRIYTGTSISSLLTAKL